MKKFYVVTCTLIAAVMALFSCKKSDNINDPNSDNTVTELTSMNVPPSFNYNTSADVQLDITMLAPDNTPVKSIPVNILDKPEEEGGKILFTSLTNSQGKISGSFKLPAYYSEVIVDPAYIGLMRNAVVKIVSNKILCTIGGADGYSGNVVPAGRVAGKYAYNAHINDNAALPKYKYLGSYTNQGKPNYLEPVNDIVSGELLSFINASLPERRPVMTYHPDYLLNNVETNINIIEQSDVWLTFISEGAGWTNSIAFFTYPTGNPPQSESDIDTLRIVLPNASLRGSGGELVSGNRVKLGRFDAGTSIGFVLIANGWNGSSVASGSHRAYSIDKLNPESLASLKRHSVLLYDNTNGLFLVGMEDMRRDDAGCDHDFNDCIFSIKSNPVEAISITNVNPIDKPIDKDGDGVTDIYDKFPEDPTRAYINYYPSEDGYGTLAFEDNWPYMGDFDVNDLVVDYRYKLINNGLNRTVEMDADYVIKAVGATFTNGFGVEFPFPANYVHSVEGSLAVNGGIVNFAANGCEAGQTKAVIIPFDDAFAVMGSDKFINTYPANPYITPKQINMALQFNTPIQSSEMGSAPFNPFIFINKTRSREAHLAGYTPTQLADSKYFKTGQDNTSPSQNRYYKTTNNLPYGLAFTETFEYPIEGKAINSAYTKFISWAQSGGSSYTNWYSNDAYKQAGLLYKK